VGITATFAEPYYSGTVAVASEVPGLFPVGLAGRTYLVDLLSGQFHRQSIPLLRTQADTQQTPGEHTINPEDLWRRSAEDWSHGAGQTYFDRDSDPARFRSSKGIDPWTRWQASLLPDTDQKLSSANTNLYLTPAGARLYVCDGTAVKYTADVTVDAPTWTSVTSTPAAAATSIASDGFNVWTAHTASGIYSTNTGTGAAAAYTAGTVTLVRYVKGRLMAANANSVYNVIVGGGAALPTALLTHANTGFVWVDVAEGRTHIYLAGYAGDKSLIYSTTIKADGTALDTPAVAGELPDGEIVRSMQGYLGYLLIGTDKGWRFAIPDSSGKITLGKLVTTTAAVGAFEGQDRFVWYGWTNYDSVSTGLGRIDLSVFTDGAGLQPAYASDLMVTGQGTVQSVVTFQSLRVFSVSGLGIYGEWTSKVASGTLDSGLITYGIPDIKMGVYLLLRHEPLVGTVGVSVATDSGTMTSVGTSSEASSPGTSITVGQLLGRTFETRLTLNRSAALTTGPTVTRATLRSYPIPARGEIVTLPIVLHESLNVNDQERPVNVRTEFATLRALTANERLVLLQLGAEALSVFVEDFDWQPTNMTQDGSWWNGVMTMKLKAVVE
jgi:hypothetical protein